VHLTNYYATTPAFNPLSANVEYTPHKSDVTCSRCRASYRQNH